MKSATSQPIARSESQVATNLVEQIQLGNKAAEQELVRRYQKGLEVVLFQRTSDRFMLEDVIQDTWVIVITKVRNEELRDPSRLAAFIIQVAKNQLIMKFRKHRKNEEPLDDVKHEPLSTILTPEQESQNAQLGETINIVFSELKQPRDQEILRKFYLSGEPKSALCREYGLTPSHFDRVLFRARKRFKELWDSRMENRDMEN